MNFGNIQGLVNTVEQVVFDYEVTGSAASSISTGNILNGDEDGWYTIIFRLINGVAPTVVNLIFNGDTGTNYGYRGIYAGSTTVVNSSGTGQTGIPFGYGDTATGRTELVVARMYAKSGAVRLINHVRAYNISGTTVDSLLPMSGVWSNTADNITNLAVTATANGLAVGTRIIILKSNNFTNGTPTGVITTPYIKGSWVRVGSQVLGSAASSVTFSGLDGDRDVVYYLSTASKVEANGQNINWYFDANTSDYGRQYLAATDTTVSAARDTGYPAFCGGGSTSVLYQASTHLIFAKQGFIRPSISQVVSSMGGTSITSIYTLGNSYSVTNTNIGSITVLVTGGGNNISTGSQFDLFALRPNG